MFERLILLDFRFFTVRRLRTYTITITTRMTEMMSIAMIGPITAAAFGFSFSSDASKLEAPINENLFRYNAPFSVFSVW